MNNQITKQYYDGESPSRPPRHEVNLKKNRVIFINDDDWNWLSKFWTNYIWTTKYNVISFLPLSILMQFWRAANIYFLIIMIINLIPQLVTVTPWTSITPLLFVLTISIVRELIEDIWWYKSDRSKYLLYKKLTMFLSQRLTNLERKSKSHRRKFMLGTF